MFMEPLRLDGTDLSPEIILDPGQHHFSITGVSRPEDVRSFYYPVIEWCNKLETEFVDTGKIKFDKEHPLKLTIKLKYFNSSSAKFLYDIFIVFGKISRKDQQVEIDWYYDEGDDDMLDAGQEMSDIAEIPFSFIENKES